METLMTAPIDRRSLKLYLERLYQCYNRREYVHPDPLEFLYRYPDPGDREIVGLIASSLSYGRVVGILKSIEAVLAVLGPSPREFIVSTPGRELEGRLNQFRHRWTTGTQIAALLSGMRRAIERYESLEGCFRAGLSRRDESILPATGRFVRELKTGQPLAGARGLLASPGDGSACKRMNLFLRWMVRCDAVDPGGWDSVPVSMLIVPLDVHMHRVCIRLGLTERKQANLRTAIEITDELRQVCPEDPVRYDFAMTRPGIRGINEPGAARVG